MVDFFLYDNSTGAITLNEYEILLVKEFATLYDTSRNKCKEDPTGINRLRAWREFKYIFLMLDFKSPYLEYIEQERHEQAMKDSELTDKEWEAIQAGAISHNLLTQILNNADLDVVRQLAMPKQQHGMSDAKIAQAKQLLGNGYTVSEVAEHLGVSPTTISDAMKGGR